MPIVKNTGTSPVAIEGVIIKPGNSTLIHEKKWNIFLACEGAQGLMDTMLSVVTEGDEDPEDKKSQDPAPPPPSSEISDEDWEKVSQALGEMLEEDPDKADKDLWMNDGRPDVRELNSRTGLKYKAKDRDAAWARYQSEHSDPPSE